MSEAAQFFLEAKSHPEALYEAGMCYLHGLGLTMDQQKAMEKFRAAADCSNPHLQSSLLYGKHLLEKECFETALEYLGKSQQAEGWYTIGMTSKYDLNTRCDCLKKASLLKHNNARFEYGQLLLRRTFFGNDELIENLPEDILSEHQHDSTQGYNLIYEAAVNGHVPSMLLLGDINTELYATSPEPRSKKEEARKWYKEAAIRNSGLACLRLAETLIDENAISKKETILNYLTQAADKEILEASKLLIKYYIDNASDWLKSHEVSKLCDLMKYAERVLEGDGGNKTSATDKSIGIYCEAFCFFTWYLKFCL
ncbi:hypothetical protein GEMRC1_006883 [Eukaryota sp. GEM-RC1]